jgi:hypothetical protein
MNLKKNIFNKQQKKTELKSGPSHEMGITEDNHYKLTK